MSGSDEELKRRLENSDSVASLRAEQECVAAFKNLPGWSVQHGSFFRDSVTGKLREIDVHAHRSFLRGMTGGERNPSATLEFLLEVKSMSGYHVVLSPDANGYNDCRVRSYWTGEENRERTFSTFLKGIGCDGDQALQLAARFNQIAYPGGESVVSDLTPEGPDVSFVATAFRETNIKGDKDLENSVTWKAILGLRSAVDGLIAARSEGFRSDVELMFNAAREDGDDVVAAVERELTQRVRTIYLYHSVVVLDGARLWTTQGPDLVEIEHGRLAIHEHQPHRHGWVDLVTRKGFHAWIKRASAFYAEAIAAPEEAVIRERALAFQTVFEAIMDRDSHVEIHTRKRKSRSEPRRFKIVEHVEKESGPKRRPKLKAVPQPS